MAIDNYNHDISRIETSIDALKPIFYQEYVQLAQKKHPYCAIECKSLLKSPCISQNDNNYRDKGITSYGSKQCYEIIKESSATRLGSEIRI